jgi:hypothetical protein
MITTLYVMLVCEALNPCLAEYSTQADRDLTRNAVADNLVLVTWDTQQDFIVPP